MQINDLKENDLSPVPVTKYAPLCEMSMAFIDPVKPSSSLMAEPS